MQNIIHICERKAWMAAVEAGRYEPDSLKSDGFIHCSRPDQVLEVANTFYPDRDDLVLIIIDPQRVRTDILWEDPSGSHPPGKSGETDVFPHIYGPLNLDAVSRVLNLERKPDGSFILPSGI